jgi:hypothetical protein
MNKELPEEASKPTTLKKGDLKQEASVLEYVNAAAASSDRARTVIIVLMVATVLLAIELRNTSYSWIDERIAVRTAALKLLETNYAPDKLNPLVATDPELYRRATLFVQRRKLNPSSEVDKKLLEKELDDYRKVAIEQVSFIHIPFFGAIFDHNDIGMFGGFTFAVLLLWLRYSLARELSNLNLLFTHQDFGENLKRCYELLAMQQMLTVPPLPNSSVRHRWRWIPKVLYFIPLPIYAGQLYFDFTSIFPVGEILGRGKMWLLIVTSILFLVLILIFTFWCIKISRKVDKVWDKAASRIYPEHFGMTKHT